MTGSAPAVLLTRAPEPLVRQALAVSRTPCWLLPGPWCVLVPQTADEVERYGELSGLSWALGRYGAIELTREPDGLLVGVWRRGGSLHALLDPDDGVDGPGDDLHRADAAGIAWVAGRRDLVEPLADLIGGALGVDDLVAGLTRLLDLPEGVDALLRGAPPAEVPGMVRVEPRGFVGAVLAGMRGEFDVPGSRDWAQVTARWERERPAAYRVAAAGEAAGFALLAWRAARQGRPVRAALLALGAVGGAWSTGPPRGRWPYRR